MRLLSRLRFRPSRGRAGVMGRVCRWVWMVVRFVCVIRVPVCARVSRVCPMCVPAPPVSFTFYRLLSRPGFGRRVVVRVSRGGCVVGFGLEISTADRTHARIGPDTQQAQAHNHTQNSNPRRWVWMRGCEVRLCDPCVRAGALVCPVCVPAPPGVFLPVLFTGVSAGRDREITD